MVWNLYGKSYNLEKYIPFHPGGSIILENTKEEKDITALFETYHAFSNKEYYQKKLEMYLEKTENNEKNEEKEKEYDFTNYRLLTNRIRERFPNRISIKAPYTWYIQNVSMFFLYIYLFFSAIMTNRCIFAHFAGMTFISLGFNVFHDGSHYAISIKPNINYWLSKVWASWGIWNATIWFYHHVLNHHSYTGIEGADPDLYHLIPFFTKTELTNHKKHLPLLYNKSEWLPFVMIGFPGYYVGQILSYLLLYKNKIFRIPIPVRNYYDGIDRLLILGKIYFLYRGGFFVSVHYILALNFWYFINIALDHDTYENIVENHYSGNDWLKIQVCHSSNFLNDNILWTHFFGSINYQIEHHLFPNMSSVHYPTIAPIVREFCKEKGIPYVHHATLTDAFRSYMKMIRFRNSHSP